MRRLNWKSFLVIGVLTVTTALAVAQDNTKSEPQGMPPMGPPDEMKECTNLVGTWDVDMKMHMSMDPKDTTWMTTKGVATYKYILGGAALEMGYEGDMMGQKFSGGGWQCYDRETKQWQMTWIDNMSARVTMYTGTKDKSGFSVTGEDRMMGQAYLSRISTTNDSPSAFDWKGEYSMDGGKTWMVWATAKYVKRK